MTTRRPRRMVKTLGEWDRIGFSDFGPHNLDLEPRDFDGQGVRPFDDFSDGGVDSEPKILDHCSGDRRSFNASLSVLSRGRKSLEDVGDIVYPTVVECT